MQCYMQFCGEAMLIRRSHIFRGRIPREIWLAGDKPTFISSSNQGYVFFSHHQTNNLSQLFYKLQIPQTTNKQTNRGTDSRDIHMFFVTWSTRHVTNFSQSVTLLHSWSIITCVARSGDVGLQTCWPIYKGSMTEGSDNILWRNLCTITSITYVYYTRRVGKQAVFGMADSVIHICYIRFTCFDMARHFVAQSLLLLRHNTII